MPRGAPHRRLDRALWAMRSFSVSSYQTEGPAKFSPRAVRSGERTAREWDTSMSQLFLLKHPTTKNKSSKPTGPKIAAMIMILSHCFMCRGQETRGCCYWNRKSFLLKAVWQCWCKPMWQHGSWCTSFHRLVPIYQHNYCTDASRWQSRKQINNLQNKIQRACQHGSDNLWHQGSNSN